MTELLVLLLGVIGVLIATNVWIWRNAQTQVKKQQTQRDNSQNKLDELVNTLRFSTEKIVRANERRYQALFENSNDAILIVGLDGVITVANERSAELFGMGVEQLVGNNIMGYFRHTDDRDRFLQALLNNTNDYPLYECEFTRPDDTHFFAEVNQTVVQDADGAVLHFQIIVRDITARKQAATQLTHERNLLRTIIDAIPDSIFAVDYSGRYILSNKAHYKAFGQTLENILGKTTHDLFSPELATAYAREDMSVIQARRTLHVELPEESSGGNLYWRDITKVPLFDDNGIVIGVAGIIRDITDTKNASEHLKSLNTQLNLLHQIDNEVNSTLEMEFITARALDTAVRLSRANAGFIAVLRGEEMRVASSIGDYGKDTTNYLLNYHYGITSRILVNQKPELILDVSQDPDYQPDIPSTKALIAIPLISQEQLVGIISLETSRPQYFTADVFEFVKLVAARVSAGIDNARLYAMLQGKLSETEALYRQADMLYQDKSRLEQLKTDMIRIASHDLKNPLAIIKGYMALMQADPALSAENIEFLGEIEKATRRMEKILEDILSLEKISQRSTENYVQFDLQTHVQHAVHEFLPQAKNKLQHLQLHCDFAVMPIVKGDEAQIYEAITNLIGNAIKYTPNEGKVDVYLQIPNQTQVTFKVVDTGYGVPAEMQESLFQPFFRAKTDETRAIEGTGLGLHLVKNIIERHGGKMLFVSEYGKGSTFGFELPMV
jgi:PAS domain S-box-containing protein